MALIKKQEKQMNTQIKKTLEEVRLQGVESWRSGYSRSSPGYVQHRKDSL